MLEGVDIAKARAAKTRVLGRLADLGQVNGVGLARLGKGYGVKVNLSKPLASDQELPADVDGVPLVVEYVGTITKR